MAPTSRTITGIEAERNRARPERVSSCGFVLAALLPPASGVVVARTSNSHCYLPSERGGSPCSLHGFGVDDQAAAPLSPQPTPTACGRARLTSQVQFLAPRLKGQVIDDPEPGPFR
jgi:hypothetical protein